MIVDDIIWSDSELVSLHYQANDVELIISDFSGNHILIHFINVSNVNLKPNLMIKEVSLVCEGLHNRFTIYGRDESVLIIVYEESYYSVLGLKS